MNAQVLEVPLFFFYPVLDWNQTNTFTIYHHVNAQHCNRIQYLLSVATVPNDGRICTNY